MALIICLGYLLSFILQKLEVKQKAGWGAGNFSTGDLTLPTLYIILSPLLGGDGGRSLCFDGKNKIQYPHATQKPLLSIFAEVESYLASVVTYLPGNLDVAVEIRGFD